MSSDTTSYLDRIEICGFLKLVTPLHIGWGETERSNRVEKRLLGVDEPQPVEVATTIRDHHQRPCIPGTTLKGALRRLCSEDSRDRLFGYSRSEGDEAEKRWMGRLLVCSAPMPDTGKPCLTGRPYPDAERGTFVDSRTKIDPASGTADVGAGEGGKLFHIEMVGPGARFDLRLTLLGPTDQDLERLATLLGQMVDGFFLGRGGKLGQGRAKLCEEGLEAIRVSLSDQGAWRRSELLLDVTASQATKPTRLRTSVELRCDGPYLTLDGSHEPPGSGAAPQLIALTDEMGRPILGASSVIGALRARSLWLARLENPEIEDRPTRVLGTLEPPSVLSPVERLFGVAGWGSAVAIRALEPVGACTPIQLTSVAIDRFTGGPRDGALFTTDAYLGAAFRVDLALSERNGISDDDQRLFERLIADVRCNGLMLGHGAAKGFGWFRVADEPEAPPPAAEILANLPEPPKPSWDMEQWKRIEAFERNSGKAPYTFIKINPEVVAAEAAPAHDKPAPDQVSGWLDLAWIVESPLLLGVENSDQVVESFRLGDQGPHAIPGASLRGMIRAVFEIATFSKLGAINDRHRFALRDFDHERYRSLVMQPASGVQAGWLQEGRDGWQITPCSFRRIDYPEIASHAGTKRDWTKLDLDQKMAALAGKLAVSFVALSSHGFEDDLASLDLTHPSAVGAPSDGTLVLAGPFVGMKRYETVFFARGAAFPIPADAVAELDFVYSRSGKKHREPDGNWAYWKCKATAGEEVPVFYVGRPGGDEFHVGLSRLFRLAHARSVGEVAASQQPPKPGLDMTEALFGFVRDTKQEDRQQALKGRVFFETARCLNDDEVVAMDPQTTVLLGPRASFAPYYLQGQSKDWSAPLGQNGPSLAGRKRYPARGTAQPLPLNPPPGVASTLRFITAKGAQPLVFKGRIRVHNLTQVELGGLLWAITFGGRATTHRHMVGRAKSYGHGQLRTLVQSLRDDQGIPLDQAILDGCRATFVRHMEKCIEHWADRPEIRQLLASADPALGAELIEHLTYPGNYDAYAEIRSQGGRLNRYPELVR